jgi:predicted RNase H-like HicB family nuclease
MQLTIEYEQEEDGRWLAEVMELPGTLAYGQSPDEAVSKAKALALRVIAEQIEHGERDTRDLKTISFAAA